MSETPKEYMVITPNSDFVLLEGERYTSNGLVPAGQRDDLPGYYMRFRVLAVGPGRPTSSGSLAPIMFKPGDYVVVPAPVGMPGERDINKMRMPCTFVRVGEPEAGGRILFIIHADDILFKAEGEYKVPGNSGIVLARQVDSRVVEAAKKVRKDLVMQ